MKKARIFSNLFDRFITLFWDFYKIFESFIEGSYVG